MAGIDDNVALTGDWGLASPSPRTFFSRMLEEDHVTRSVSEHSGSGRTGEFFSGPHEPSETGKKNMQDGAEDGDSGPQKLNSRGGLVERMAARAGFNAPRLNTESMRTTDLSLNSDIHSPYLTIPPGLSPTTLLDSPVFLANSLVSSCLFVFCGFFIKSVFHSFKPKKIVLDLAVSMLCYTTKHKPLLLLMCMSDRIDNSIIWTV